LIEAPLVSEAACEFVEKVTPVGSCEATKFKVSVPVPVFLRQMFALTVAPCGTATQVMVSPVSVYPDAVAQFVVPVTPAVTAKRFVTGILTDELFRIVSWVAAYATAPATDIATKAMTTLRSLTLLCVSRIFICCLTLPNEQLDVSATGGLLRLCYQNHPVCG